MIKNGVFEMFHLTEMSLSAELFISCSILQLTFYAVGTTYQRKHGFVLLNQQIYYIGALILGLATLLILNEDLLISNSFSGNNSIINDYLGFSAKLVICLTSILFLLIVKISYKEEPIQHNFEYIIFILISILGSLLICSSNDLITAYLSIELQSVAFYLMAAFKKNSSYSVESGLKYFIIGSLSSAFFLFGSAIVYGCFGSLNFDDIKMFYSLLSTPSIINNDIPFIFDFGYSEKLGLMLMTLSLESFSKLEILFHGYIKSYSYLEDDSRLEEIYSLKDSFIKENFPELTIVGPYYTYERVHGYFGWLTSILVWNDFIECIDRTKFWSIVKSDFFNESAFWIIPASKSIISYDNIPSVCFNLNLLDKTLIDNQMLLLQKIWSHYIDFFNIFDKQIMSSTSALNLDLISIGFMLICISLFIKLALAPFHFWSLDVYEGSPNTTTVFFAVVPKIGLFVLLLRICYSSFYYCFSLNWQIYFFIISVLSIFVGSLGGLEQRKLKTLLAYSSISHTGYLLLAFSSGSVEGMQMMLYYLSIFMLSGLCFWSVFLFIQQKRNFYFKKHNKELGDLVLLRESNPMLALILSITLFSIAGIPPIIGFLAKIGIFLVAIGSSAYLISILSILFSVASTFYYIRIIKILYFENTLVGKLYLPISTKKSLLISILSLMLVILCVDPMILYLLFTKATLLNSC